MSEQDKQNQENPQSQPAQMKKVYGFPLSGHGGVIEDIPPFSFWIW